MIAGLWFLILGGGTLLAQQWLEQRSLKRSPSIYETASGKQALVIKADRYGQYHILGSANGQGITFLVDTGASEISIPAALADRLRLKRGRSYPVMTANGSVTVYSTTLNQITVGPFQLSNVRAHINPGMQGEFALLGMSFLRYFELLQRSGEMTISVP